jgi:hypothetical protein
VTKFRQ